MSKDILIFSDLHLKPDTSNLIFNKILPDLTKIAIENKIKTIICLGDIWEQRYRIPVLEQILLYRWFLELQHRSIDIILLVGNHDQIDLTGNNSLEVFNSLDNVMVYSNPIINNFGGWIPYRKDIEVFKQAVINMKNNGVKRLFIHHDIQGALFNTKRVSEVGITSQIFDDFDIVLAGHYHHPQTVGKNCHYIGSPYATTRDGIDSPHRYIILSENNFIQSIAVNYGHVFNEITTNHKTVCKPVDARLQVRPEASLQEYAFAYLTSKITDNSKLELYKNAFTRITNHAI